MVSGLEEVLGVKLPEDLESPEARQILVRVCLHVCVWRGRGWACQMMRTVLAMWCATGAYLRGYTWSGTQHSRN